jgi:hypothetical protein
MATEELFFPHNMATSLTKIPFCTLHTESFLSSNFTTKMKHQWVWVPLLLPKPEKRRNKNTAQGFTGNDEIMQNFINKGKFLIHTFFWLNSHPFFASWSRNAADLQALRTRQARPGCEFNQKKGVN